MDATRQSPPHVPQTGPSTSHVVPVVPQSGPSTSHAPPSWMMTPQPLPSQLSFDSLRVMERRILSRRPLNNAALFSLKKSTLRRFLRLNDQRYKPKERKERLVQMVNTLVKRFLEKQRLQKMGAWPQSPQTEVPIISLPEQRPLEPLSEDHECPGPTCSCVIVVPLILANRPVRLTPEARGRLQGLSTSTAGQLRATLTELGAPPTSHHCRRTLLRQVRDVMEQLPECVLPPEQECENMEVQPPEPRKCAVCGLKKPCMMQEPCRHNTSCEDCARQLSTCPRCAKKVDSSFKIYNLRDT